MASTYGLNVIKIGGIWIFQGGRSLSALKHPEGVLTIIKSIWNYGNLAYLVANTYGLNVIKIGGIWIFQGGRSSLLGGLHVACNAHFRTRISYSSQKSCVKIWFGLVEPFKSYHLNFSWGQKPPIRGGCMWPAMPIFWLGWAIPVKSHLCKFGSDWLRLSRVIVNHLLGGVTFDLWCPFLNSDELFQSKEMCGNLVWIGRNQRYVNFEGGGRPPISGVACDLQCPFLNLAEVV